MNGKYLFFWFFQISRDYCLLEPVSAGHCVSVYNIFACECGFNLMCFKDTSAHTHTFTTTFLEWILHAVFIVCSYSVRSICVLWEHLYPHGHLSFALAHWVYSMVCTTQEATCTNISIYWVHSLLLYMLEMWNRDKKCSFICLKQTNKIQEKERKVQVYYTK